MPSAPSMRDLLNRLDERAAYPERHGESPMDFYHWIQQVLRAKGGQPWVGGVESELGQRGVKVAQVMAEKGVIAFHLDPHGEFGGEFTMTPGPYFPKGGNL